MTGVEILSSEIVYETECSIWPIVVFTAVGFLSAIIICIISWCHFGFNLGDIPLILGITIIGAFIGLLGCLMTMHETDTINYVKHKVTVSDGVDFTEFMDKYEIIDQEGKIYTVKEK